MFDAKLAITATFQACGKASINKVTSQGHCNPTFN